MLKKCYYVKKQRTKVQKNTFINTYRRSVRKNALLNNSFDLATGEIQANIYSNTTDAQINHKELLRVIDLLKDEFKLPFMRYVDGYKYKEISEELDIPIGTVKSRIFIARKELIARLKNEYSLTR